MHLTEAPMPVFIRILEGKAGVCFLSSPGGHLRDQFLGQRVVEELGFQGRSRKTPRPRRGVNAVSCRLTGLFQILVVSLLFTIFSAPVMNAQAAVNDFLGAPWGSSMQQVRQTLKQRKDFKEKPLDSYHQQSIKENEAPGHTELVFIGTVAEHYASILCVFQDDALYEGVINFVDKNRPFFTKLNRYSSEWKNKKFILSLYDEIKGMLTAKYGRPVQEDDERARTHFTDESFFLLAKIAATWSVAGGTEVDEVKIKCEGISPYYMNRKDNLETTGAVCLTYSNLELLKRVTARRPAKTSKDL